MKKLMALVLSLVLVICAVPMTTMTAFAATDISTTSVTLPSATAEYTGSPIQLVPTVSDSGVTLVDGTDYTVSYINNTDLGTATVVVSGTGTYSGSVSKTFKITKNIGTGVGMVVSTPPAGPVEATGAAIEPAITVTDSGNTLAKGTDYAVLYEDNIFPGTATVTISGMGNYTGSVTRTFTIEKTFTATEPIDITIPQQVQGAGAVTGEVVKWKGETLINGTDYTLTAVTPLASLGTQTATISFTGGYHGPNRTVNFNVVSASNNLESMAGIYLNDLTATYTYSGKAITPAITVKKGDGTVLRSGVDYTLEYHNNIDAGTASIQAKGTGAYAGTLTKTFVIEKAKISDCKLNFTKDTYSYTGAPILPIYTVSIGDYTLKQSEYDYVIRDNVNTGKASITLSVKSGGTANFLDSPATLVGYFTITGNSIGSCTCTIPEDSYNYTGSAITPVVTVKNGSSSLVLGTDYSVAYKDNINAGTATITVTGIGKYSGTKEITFKIKGQTNSVSTTQSSYNVSVTGGSFNLGATVVNAGEGLKYTSSNTNVVTVSDDGTVTVKGVGKAVITISTTGTTSYDPAQKTVNITIIPNKPSYYLSRPGKNKVKVSITHVKGATRYQIRYGRVGVYRSVYTSGTYRTLKNLKSGKTYYIKVRSYARMSDGSIIWGNWTTYKKIKVK